MSGNNVQILQWFCSLSQYIDVPGATAICKALETNKHLRYIDLGMNRVRKVSIAGSELFLQVHNV